MVSLTKQDKLFKDKKILLINATKLSYKYTKLFEEFKDLIVRNGGVIQYSLQRFSTDYVICSHFEQDVDFPTINPYLIPNFEKAKSYAVPFLSHTFIYKCLETKTIQSYFITYIIKSFVLPPNKFSIILEEDEFAFFDMVSETSSLDITEQSNSINMNTQVKEPTTIIQKDESCNDLWDLFGNFDDNESQSKESIKSNKKQQQQQQQKHEEEEEEEEEDMFDLFGNLYDNKSQGKESKVSNQKQQKQKEKEEEEVDETWDFFGTLTDSSYTQNENDKIEDQDILPFDYGLPDYHYDDDNSSTLSNFEYDSPKRTTKYPSWECDRISGYYFYRKQDSFVLYDQIKNRLRMLSVGMNGLTCVITEEKICHCWGNLSRNYKLQHPIRDNRFQNGSLGHNHSLFIDKETNVWSFGLNDNGQLGLSYNSMPTTTTEMPMLNKVRDLYRVLMVSCGKNFSSALTSANHLFTWGKNDFGQLGHGHKNDLYVPTMINFSVPDYFVSDISCGTSHMLCTVSSKDYQVDYVYGWGSNHNKQVGVWATRPTQITIPGQTGLKRIFAFKNSSIILSEPNRMDIFSSNTFNLSYQKTFESMYDYTFTTIKDSIGIKVHNPFYTILFLIDKPEKLSIVESSIREIQSKITNDQIQRLLNICFDIGSLNVLKLLLKYIKIDKLINQDNNQTPLHIAAKYERSEDLVNHMLKSNMFDIDQLDNQLNTALHICTQNNNQKISICLLKNGCSRNLKNDSGHTAMHICVIDKNFSLASVLAKHGTQSIPDKSMKTPLQYMMGEDKQMLQNIIFQNEVFLSYAHKDLVFLRSLRSLFEQRSLRCWLDDYRLQAGCNWKAEITKGVEGSNVVVFIVSETSTHSLWCRKELKMCKKLGKKILPLYYHNVTVDPVLQGLFDYVPDKRIILSELSEDQLKEQVLNYSLIIKSMIKCEDQLVINQSNTDVVRNNPSKLIYMSFNPPDISTESFIKANLVQKRLPIVSKIDLQNVKLPSSTDYDNFKLENRKKLIKLNTKLFKERKQQELLVEKEKAEKKRQQFKLDMKVEKRLQKNGITKDHPDYEYFRKDYYSYFNQKNVSFSTTQQTSYYDTGSSFYSSYMASPSTEVNENIVQQEVPSIPTIDYNDIPILNETYDTTISSSSYNSTPSSFSQSNYSTDYETYNQDHNVEDEKSLNTNLEESLVSTIKNSILHLVIYTLKTDKLLDENFYEEISYSQSIGKTIIVLTNNIESKQSAPESLKSLTWYEIQYLKEEDTFEHIISLYEILEKMQNISNSILELENKE